MTERTSRTAAAALLVLGLGAMAAEVLGLRTATGLFLALGASPRPKVFSSVDGLETFSSRFFVEVDDREIEVTPALYARLRGPYARRNAWGAALAYGPVLRTNPQTAVMFSSALEYALCGEHSILRELGLAGPDDRPSVRLRIEPDPATPAATRGAIHLIPPCG